MPMTSNGEAFREIYFTARDGLRLHVRHYPAAGGKQERPVVCLPGLTRNGRDFHDIAVALSNHPSDARDVYTVDCRGRGLSAFDPDWRNYTIQVEMFDVLDFMTLSGLHNVAVIGTSRGGLIAMLIAAVQPGAIGVVVLNDMGPVIEYDGLARITGYVGRMPLPISWSDAAKMVRDLNRRHFPEIREHLWEELARQWYNEKNGRPTFGYDPNLGNTLSIFDGPMPELWPQFEALKRIPVLVLRGENSDILSPETVEEMRRRHPALVSFTVNNEGHAPLLKDQQTIGAIQHFLSATDAGRHVATMAIA
jgi:pimeloyl-ACP methyl ester carboxylesterase